MSFWTRKHSERKTSLNLPHSHEAHMQLIAKDVCMNIWGWNLATARLITCLIKWLIILLLWVFSSDFGKFRINEHKFSQLTLESINRFIILSIRTTLWLSKILRSMLPFNCKFAYQPFFPSNNLIEVPIGVSSFCKGIADLVSWEPLIFWYRYLR